MIEEKLKIVGAPHVIQKRKEENTGKEVIDDLSFTIMRMEMGLQGKKESHWVPALKEMNSKLDQIKESFIKYMADGKESHFELPINTTDLGASDLKMVNEFQDKIVKMAGLGD
jgi:hypothetical protein